jgi:hypothetical protein
MGIIFNSAAEVLNWLDQFGCRVDLQDLGPACRSKNRVIVTAADGAVTGGRHIRDAVCRAATRQEQANAIAVRALRAREGSGDTG